MGDTSKITVTSPMLPDLAEFEVLLGEIWSSKWITNMGEFHERLEKELSDYLGVPYISLFTNGTLPLLTALQALQVKGEVITTPFSFVATSHALWWNNLTPVFVDVDPVTGNIDPDKIEAAVTDRTSAILPVHIYGQPCDTERIAGIARKHDLKVIYDGAHAFGVRKDGKSILTEGDMTTLSFHATKVFNTVEGGALVVQDPEMKKQVDYLKNFGFEDETHVTGPGINSKMDEMRAAYGLLNLRHVDEAIARRGEVASVYRRELDGVPGLRLLPEHEGLRENHSYFPVFIDESRYGMSRDALYEKLKSEGIFARRYFFPLISSFAPYRDLPSASKENLPIANSLSDSVLCIPMHHALSDDDVNRIIKCIRI